MRLQTELSAMGDNAERAAVEAVYQATDNEALAQWAKGQLYAGATPNSLAITLLDAGRALQVLWVYGKQQLKITTSRCPDGTFYGAVLDEQGTVLAMSPPMSSRDKARTWALKKLSDRG